MSDFAVGVSNWVGATVTFMEETYRKSAEELSRRIINDTPIDEDHKDAITARGDWVSDVGQIPADLGSSRDDQQGLEAQADVHDSVVRWKPSEGETFYLGHYGEYITLLEYGLYPEPEHPKKLVPSWFSSQAPAGMVGIHVEEWDDIVRDAKAEAKAQFGGAL